MADHHQTTQDRIAHRTARIGVIGQGYVGLPLAAACAQAGFATLGFDIDPAKIDQLNAGSSYIDAVTSGELQRHVQAGTYRAIADFAQLADCDVVVICVPTPLSRQREPDLRYVIDTSETILRHLHPGQLIVLESTTWPGTTQQVVRPILERGGLSSELDFFLAFSPEREDPGNAHFRTTSIPKVLAGDGPGATSLAASFYGAVVDQVVEVSSPAVAEAVKITENVFRAVNIALVNELKVIYDAMGIDVWEVIDAAATKPFGFMPFYPGPGLGGHCIPIDPFYLTWKSREYGLTTRFIELAGEINLAMPHYVVTNLERALDARLSRSLGSSRILMMGLAYKKNISDIRESPALAVLDLLERRGVKADYFDPHVPEIPMTREHAPLAGRRSVVLSAGTVSAYDAVLIVTDHDAVDYARLAAEAKLIVDARNAMGRRGLHSDKVIKT